ncbi:MAG: hypothetical protein IKU65_03250 [Oscillospiraceae bacterium]|nr:hypothetical protein [Oscillospiraceae bacterium]
MKKLLSLVLASVLALTLCACGDKVGKMLRNADVGDTVTFGTYEQDNNEENGKEAIEWTVLSKEENRVLLLSKYVIDCIPFNNELQEGIIWEDSSIREWLNSDFISTAFSEKEAAKIEETENVNDPVSDYRIPEMPSTKEKVFFISINEIYEYFPRDTDTVFREESIAFPTEYAKEKGVELRRDGAVMWWLRESTVDGRFGACADDLGKRFHRGREMDRTDVGIRPAMWLTIENK